MAISGGVTARRGKFKGAMQKFLDDVNKASSKQSFQDDRMWKLTVDAAGNGRAILRFLPDPDGEFFVRLWRHSFKGPTGLWYIENSLTTIGQPDPVGEMNSQLWATGIEANQKLVRDRKRQLTYLSNVLVVKDPAKPENEGKVFVYSYGAKIFAKIKALAEPEFDDQEPVNPFDWDEGANFVLKASKVQGFRNYDASVFESPTKLPNGEKIAAGAHKLAAFVAPDQFKSYAELQSKLNTVLSGGARQAAQAGATAQPKAARTATAPAHPAVAAAPVAASEESAESVEEVAEDINDFFSGLDGDDDE